MDSLGFREGAIEANFQHQQMVEFKTMARRNRLFGLWAAQLLGLPADLAEDYARSVVTGSFCTSTGNEVITKIFDDLQNNEIIFSETRLRKQLDFFYQDAQSQIISE